jgi:tetratricopeptide (TPR) repeat protein
MLKEIKQLVSNLIRNSENKELFQEIKSKIISSQLSLDEKTNLLEGSHIKAVRANQHILAFEFLKLAIEIAPENESLILKTAEFSDTQVWLGEETIVLYKMLQAIKPDDEDLNDRIEDLELESSNWEKLLDKYVSEAEESTETELAAHMFFKAAEVASKYSDDIDNVELLLIQALENDASNKDIVRQIAHLYRSKENYGELAEHLISSTATFTENEEIISSMLEIASLFVEHLDKAEEAIVFINKVLEINPKEEKAKALLMEAYTILDRMEDLIAFYEEEINSSHHPDPGIFLQLGMLWWKKVGDLNAAEPYFQKIRKSEPASPLLLNFYSEYYKLHDDYMRYNSLLQQAMRAVKNDPVRTLEIARILANASIEKNPDKAIDVWKRILKKDKTNSEARNELKSLYEYTEKWSALIEIYKEEEHVLDKEDTEGRVAIMMKMANIIEEHMAVDVMAVNVYKGILKIDPNNDVAITALAQKYEAMGRWKEVITIYQQKADNSDDITEKKSFLKTVANCWMEKLSNPNRAAEPLEEILDIDPTDIEVINLLKEIYETRRNWKALFGLREKELSLISDESEKLPLLIELAKFAQAPLGNIKLSIETWNRVLERDEYDLDAIEALIVLYEREKRYPALVEILRRKIDMLTDDEALPLLEKVGTLLTSKMDAMGPLSVEIWQKVHSLKPGHPKAMKILKDLYASNHNWDELETLFSERENWVGYIETLSHAAERTTNSDEKRELYFKVAQAYTEKLGKPERAIKPYEKILKVEPQNALAAKNLLPLYENSKKWQLAASMYEILFNNSDDPYEKLEWLEKLIQTNEEELKNPKECFKWCGEAYIIDPSNDSIIEKFEKFAAISKNWEKLSEIYNENLDNVEGDDKLDLCAKLARIYVDELTELDKGEAIWKKVLEIDPQSDTALKGLAYIFEIEENWDGLNNILTQQIDASSDPQETLWAREKMASITENQLQDREKAINLYNDILDIDAFYLPALKALDQLYESEKRYEDLVKILLSERDIEEEEEVSSNLNFRLGIIFQTKLENPEKALGHFSSVLGFNEDHNECIKATREILDAVETEDLKVKSAKLLSPFYQREEMWEDYTIALEVIAEFENDHQQQVEYYHELLAIITQKVGDMGKGFLLAIALFRLVPEDAENRQKLRTLAKLDEKLSVLKDNYLELIEKDEDGLKLILAWEVALIEEEDNANIVEAEKFYSMVLSEDALHEDAFLALERIFGQAERWEDTRTLYTQKAEALNEVSDRKEMLLKLSMLNEDRIGDIDAAIESYSAIRELVPGSPEAFEPLVRLFELSDKWEDLASIYEEELEYTEESETRVQLFYKRCDIYLHKLKNESDAVELIHEILLLDQNHEPTRVMLVEMLENPGTRQDSAGILVDIYEKESNFEQLIDMLEIKLEAAEDDVDAVEILSKEGKILTINMGEPEKAFQSWRRAISRDPSNIEVRSSIEHLAMAINSYNDLVEVWTEAIKAADDDNDLVLLYLEKIAVIYEKQLSEPQKAIDWYHKLLSKAGDDNELKAKTANSLINLYSAIGEWIEIIELHKLQLGWTDWDEERKNIYRKIANLQEDMLDAPEDAAKTYDQLLEEFPEDDESIERLESIYSRIEKWSALVKVLVKKVELSSDRDVRISCLSRIAILKEESLEDVEGAADAWSEILNEDSNNDEALRYLARLNESLGRWQEVFDFVERELALTDESLEVRSLNYRLGFILQIHLDEPERAINFYRSVIEEEPTHAKAKQALESLLQEDEMLALQAAEILEDIYVTENDWDKLTGLFVLRAGYSVDPHEKVNLFLKIAQIKEDDLGEPLAAFGFYGQALREATSEPELPEILAHLQRLASLESKWKEMVELYIKVGEDIVDPKIQEQMYLLLADVSRDELDDLETSQRYYEKVLENDPENGHALDALERVYEESKNWEALLSVYIKRSEMATDDDDARFEALVNAAKICKDKLELPKDAIEHYNTILEFKPAEIEIFSSLEGLLFDLESWESLIELYEHRIRYSESISEVVEIRFSMGEIFMDSLEETERALESFCASLGGDPSSDETVQRLEKFLENEDYAGTACEVLVPIYAARQDFKNLIKVFSLQRNLLEEPEEKAPLTKRIAELYETVMEDLEKAFEWYGFLLLEQPQNISVRDRLTNLTELLDKWQEISVVFAQIIEDAYGEEEHILQILERLARIYSTKLNKVDDSLGCYKKIIENDRNRESIFGELELLLIDNERWQDLLEVYREAADAVYDPEEKNVFLFKICNVLDEKLEELDKAVEVYKEILEGSMNNEKAIESLTKLYTKLGKWEDLVEHLTMQVENSSDPSVSIPLNIKLAELHNEKLEDPSSAVDSLESILSIDELNEKVIDYLEKLLRQDSVKLRVAAILQPIYLSLNYWDQLIQVYEVQIQLIDDDYQKIKFLKECTNLYDNMSDNLPKAFKSLSQAWKLDASDRGNLEELYNLSLRQGNWAELIDVLEAGIEDLYDTELQVDVLMRIALIQSETLEETELSIASYRRVLEIQEDHLDALTKLSSLLLGTENWNDLSVVLAQKSELLTDTEETVVILRQLARLYHDLLEKPELAIETWQKLNEFSQNDEEALKALEKLFENSEKWSELADTLKSIISLGNSDWIDTAFKLSSIQETKLDDTYEAISALTSIINDSPDNKDALEKLSNLYRKEENWQELISIFDRMVTIEPDDSKRNGLIFDSAVVLQKEMSDVDSALEKYRFILDFDNSHAGAISELEELLLEEDYLTSATIILEPIYLNHGNDTALIKMYKLLLENESDPDKKQETLRSVAELYEKVQSFEDAFNYWGLLFKENPADNEVEQQLHRIAAMDNSWKNVIEIFDDVIEEIYDTPLKKSIFLTETRIFEISLEDVEGAVSVMEKAADSIPDDMEILGEFDRLLVATKKYEKLAEVIEMESSSTIDPIEKAQFLFRLGTLRFENFDDGEGAIESWKETLDINENHEETISILEELMEKGGELLIDILNVLEPVYEKLSLHKKLVTLLEYKVKLAEDASDKATYYERAATISTDLGEIDDALKYWGFATEAQPDEPNYIDQFINVADISEKQSFVIEKIKAIIEGDIEDSVAISMALKTAPMALRIGNKEAAEEFYCSILKREEENVDALNSLEELYRIGDETAKLVDILTKKAALIYDPTKKRGILVEIATLSENHLDNIDKVVEAWVEILELNEADLDCQVELMRLYEKMEKWEELVEVMRTRMNYLTDMADAQEIRRSIASILHTKLNNIEEAEETWREAYDMDPNDDLAYNAILSLYKEKEEWDELKDLYFSKLSQISVDTDKIPVLQDIAKLCKNQLDEADEAGEYYKQILEIDPSNTKAFSKIENLYILNEQFYDLIEILKSRVEFFNSQGDGEKSVYYLDQMARIWEERLEAPEEAIKILEQILSTDPGNVTALTGMARLHENLGNWEDCQQFLERAALLEPKGREGAELAFRRGNVAIKLEDEDTALARWEEALSLHRQHEEAFNSLTELVKKRGDKQTLVRLYQMKLSVFEESEGDPEDKLPILIAVGDLFVELGTSEAAFPFLEEAIKIAPNDLEVKRKLGDIYFASGNNEKAMEIYTALADMLSSDRKAKKQLAIIYQRMSGIKEKTEDYTEAIDLATKAQRLDPTYIVNLINLAKLNIKIGDLDKSIKFYKSLLFQKLGDTITKDVIFFELAKIYVLKEDMQNAKSSAKRGLSENPKNDEIKEFLANL